MSKSIERLSDKIPDNLVGGKYIPDTIKVMAGVAVTVFGSEIVYTDGITDSRKLVEGLVLISAGFILNTYVGLKSDVAGQKLNKIKNDLLSEEKNLQPEEL